MIKCYEELTEREKQVIRDYCIENEEKFREFIISSLDDSGFVDKNIYEKSYEFAKYSLREDKINELLNDV